MNEERIDFCFKNKCLHPIITGLVLHRFMHRNIILYILWKYPHSPSEICAFWCIFDLGWFHAQNWFWFGMHRFGVATPARENGRCAARYAPFYRYPQWHSNKPHGPKLSVHLTDPFVGPSKSKSLFTRHLMRALLVVLMLSSQLAGLTAMTRGRMPWARPRLLLQPRWRGPLQPRLSRRPRRPMVVLLFAWRCSAPCACRCCA